MTTLMWWRRDLRLADQPALRDALGDDTHGVFVIDPPLWHGAGAPRRAWVAASVRALDESLAGRLRLVVGDPIEQIPRLAREVGAESVHVTGEFTPYALRRDRAVAEALAAGGTRLTSTGTPYAVAPGTVLTGGGTAYQVFTPFSRAWREHAQEPPVSTPEVRLADAPRDAAAWQLVDDAVAECPGLPAAGERAALDRWAAFLDEALDGYDTDRDRPDRPGTTGLSPYLKVGAVHPRTLLADLRDHEGPGVDSLVSELAWREFYADVLWHHPASGWRDLRPLPIEYDDARDAADLLAAWREGRTGFPIVDAGMRQLSQTGWMHNRVRMITASFLCKDLHLWWPVGARHFLDSLIDGDLASNSHGWQWVAGTGTDASPYFRVFNPITQGERFDPSGDYVRRWVPELADLPGKAAHQPWQHGGAAGYPDPIVDHAQARVESLARYERAKDRRQG